MSSVEQGVRKLPVVSTLVAAARELWAERRALARGALGPVSLIVLLGLSTAVLADAYLPVEDLQSIGTDGEGEMFQVDTALKQALVLATLALFLTPVSLASLMLLAVTVHRVLSPTPAPLPGRWGFYWTPRERRYFHFAVAVLWEVFVANVLLFIGSLVQRQLTLSELAFLRAPFSWLAAALGATYAWYRISRFCLEGPAIAAGHDPRAPALRQYMASNRIRLMTILLLPAVLIRGAGYVLDATLALEGSRLERYLSALPSLTVPLVAASLSLAYRHFLSEGASAPASVSSVGRRRRFRDPAAVVAALAVVVVLEQLRYARQWDWLDQQASLERTRALTEEKLERARSLKRSAVAMSEEGNHAGAVPMLEQACPLYREGERSIEEKACLEVLGTTQRAAGQHEAARQTLLRVLEMSEAQESPEFVLERVRKELAKAEAALELRSQGL